MLNNYVPSKNKYPNRYVGQIHCTLAQNIEHIFTKIEELFENENFFTSMNELIMI